jgi:hypothetical protein
MPRKSRAALEVASPVPLGALPEPPAELTDFQAGLWHSIVKTKPADWFNADSFPLLISYCKMQSQAAVLDAEIDSTEPNWLRTDEGLKRYKDLTQLRVLVTGKIESLARAMRLTQQSRYDQRVAANQSDKTNGKKAPWER